MERVGICMVTEVKERTSNCLLVQLPARRSSRAIARSMRVGTAAPARQPLTLG